jgi:hypothetical protein
MRRLATSMALVALLLVPAARARAQEPADGDRFGASVLIRREADSIPDRARWMAIVLVVPFVGPPLYLAFGPSTIPAQLRSMLTAGGVAAYLVFLTLGVVFGG